jgi:hypothetical protein
MEVLINGVRFISEGDNKVRIGIAITTHNRHEVLKRAIEQHMKHLPSGALVVVIDDGSSPAAIVPDGVKLVRHEQSRGIVASKNASLTALGLSKSIRGCFSECSLLRLNVAITFGISFGAVSTTVET